MLIQSLISLSLNIRSDFTFAMATCSFCEIRSILREEMRHFKWKHAFVISLSVKDTFYSCLRGKDAGIGYSLDSCELVFSQ